MQTTGTYPVRHFIIDNFASPRPSWTVPPPESSAWEVTYDDDYSRGKRTLRDLPMWAAEVAALMIAEPMLRRAAQLFAEALAPDPLLWGGGLQVMPPGCSLETHLDGILHPKCDGVRRAVQLICFVHPCWHSDWGGALYFTDPVGRIVERIEPIPGRLVVWENTDLAYHGVEAVANDAPERVTVSVSLLADAKPHHTRMKALFMPTRSLRPACSS